jgi:hypothetical protein
MTQDPIISEIGRVRREILARFGHDVRRFGEHYMKLGKKARANGEYGFADVPQKLEMALREATQKK